MKNILKILFVYCLTTPLLSQNNVSFSVNKEYYPEQTGLINASGISFSVMHHFDFFGELGIKYNYNTMSLRIQSPSSINAVNVSAHDFYLVYGFTFINKILSMDVKPVFGVGLKGLNRDSFKIDLGALGIENNPELTQQFFTSFVSLILSKRISKDLSFFIEPGLTFYDVQNFYKTFSFKGGIDVSIQ